MGAGGEPARIACAKAITGERAGYRRRPAPSRQGGGAAAPEDRARAGEGVVRHAGDDRARGMVGDTLSFQMRALGQSAAGTITVMEDKVLIAVTLPWLLAKAAEHILPTIQKQTSLLLENESARRRRDVP